MLARSIARLAVTLGVAAVLAACGGTATPAPQGGGAGASSAPPTVANPTTAPAAGGAEGFEGSLKTSGLYSATWTVAPDAPANPFNNSGNTTMTSDKSTFGNIFVKPDGSVSFGSAATELGSNINFGGTGAKVTLDATGQFVCAFTVDTDLKGTRDGAILHLAGGLTAHWHPGAGLDCP